VKNPSGGSSAEIAKAFVARARCTWSTLAIAHTANPAAIGLQPIQKSEHMTDTPADEQPPEHEKSRLRRFEDAVHDRVLAAEVAAEEAAGYGSLTAAREAAETAVNPAHELGGDDEPAEADTGADPPKE
jgi:hypothetical protein